MKVNFSKIKFKDLSDNPIEQVKGEVVVSTALIGHRADPVMCFELAIRVHRPEDIEINTTEKELIENAIKNSEYYNNLIKAQVLLYLKNLPT